tara:strand:+ start:245 stop:358 length:114 start_codon:yes stop_codon:yes gene_type:complete
MELMVEHMHLVEVVVQIITELPILVHGEMVDQEYKLI